MVEKKVHMLIKNKPACGAVGDVECLHPVEFEGLMLGAITYTCPECVGVYVALVTITLTDDDLDNGDPK